MRRAIICLSCVAMLSMLLAAAAKREFPNEWYWDDDAKLEAAHVAIEGKPMPALDLAGWVNGEVTPADMKGKVVVVDIYATWCGPCIRAIPHNNEMLKKYKDKGFVLISVCSSSNGQDKMEQLVKDNSTKVREQAEESLRKIQG